ncbi:hypothetical protein AEBR_2029 [Halarcobacter ebronensis]|nr:hypothetical protein AEBR_2029 [Halarcobacter ebronensis]
MIFLFTYVLLELKYKKLIIYYYMSLIIKSVLGFYLMFIFLKIKKRKEEVEYARLY